VFLPKEKERSTRKGLETSTEPVSATLISGYDEKTGRPYVDIYKVPVLDDCSMQWEQLAPLIKREFHEYSQYMHNVCRS
jgi:hypothetical protein